MDNEKENKKSSDNGGWSCLGFIAMMAIGLFLGWGPFRELKRWFIDKKPKTNKIELYNKTPTQQRGRDISFGQSEASLYNGKKCGYIKSNGICCDCSGCASANWDPYVCSKCGHKCNKHTR